MRTKLLIQKRGQENYSQSKTQLFFQRQPSLTIQKKTSSEELDIQAQMDKALKFGHSWENLMIQAQHQEEEEDESIDILEDDIEEVMDTGGEELAEQEQEELTTNLGIVNPEEIEIHDDPEAHQLCEFLGALAFTSENHIFFAAGEYEPDSESGSRITLSRSSAYYPTGSY